MSNFDLVLAVGGGVILVLGLTVGFVKNRLWFSEPMVCLAVGALLGPLALGLADFADAPVDSDALLKQAARVTLAFAVMGAALRLPRRYELRHWRELAVVLGVGMPLMWLAGSLAAWLILPLAPLYCVLVGAVLTPTDPVIAASVVTGMTAEASIPARMRDSLTAESGANDGLGLLLVMLPISLLTKPSGEAWTHWATVVVLWDIVGAVVLGGLVGWLAGRVLLWARAQRFSERESTLTIGIALALTLLGLLSLIGTDGILGVFVAGLILDRALPQNEVRHEHIQEAISRFFDLPVFVLFGAMLPFEAWRQLGVAGVGFGALLLLIRRLPWWLLLRPVIPSLKQSREALFAGWFGPMGIASLYYALVAVEHTHMDMIWVVASLAAFLSILAHGVTATPFAQRLESVNKTTRR